MSLYLILAVLAVLAALVLRGAWRHVLELRKMNPEDRSAALAVDWRYWPLVGAISTLLVFALFGYSTIGTIAFAVGVSCLVISATITLVDSRKAAAHGD